jgi:molecular chaperone GrpE
MSSDTTKPTVPSANIDWRHELPGTTPASIAEQTPMPQAGAGQDAEASAAELQKAKEECASLLDRLARTQAELENLRKRTIRDKREYKDLGIADTISSLLPAIDSFDLALQTPSHDTAEFRHGLDLIRKQFDEILNRLGVKPIAAKGQPFDPHIHEAVDVTETTNAEDDYVLEELQRGYVLGDRLLRPAMVVVARRPGNKGASAGNVIDKVA